MLKPLLHHSSICRPTVLISAITAYLHYYDNDCEGSRTHNKLAGIGLRSLQYFSVLGRTQNLNLSESTRVVKDAMTVVRTLIAV